jgi:hypothetical protein
MIAATGPGRLLVSIGSRTLAELKSGTVSSMEMDLFESRWVHDRLAEMASFGEAALPGHGLQADDRGPGVEPQFATVLVGHGMRMTVPPCLAARTVASIRRKTAASRA